MKPRRLTVSYRQPDSRARFPRPAPAPMPFLRLQGRWLDQAGFAIGSEVRVRVCEGLLVLEVIDEKENRHAERD
jgi:toxic protein SymE